MIVCGIYIKDIHDMLQAGAFLYPHVTMSRRDLVTPLIVRHRTFRGKEGVRGRSKCGSHWSKRDAIIDMLNAICMPYTS